MALLDDWVERVLACFHREEDIKDPGKGPPPHDVDVLDVATLSDEAVDKHFQSLLDQLELSDARQQEMLGQTRSTKLAMLKGRQAGQYSVPSSPSSLIAILSGLLSRVEDRSLPPLPDDSPLVLQVQAVVTTLRTSDQTVLEEFLCSGGMSLLTSLLSLARIECPASARIALFVLSSIRALLNSNGGRREVLSSEECLLSIAAACAIQDARVKISALEILSGLCFASEEGPTLVLSALTQVSTVIAERTRFQRIIEDLAREYHSERETDRLRTAVMSLINALLRTGQAENSPEFRLHLRYEMLLLGMQEALEKARNEASPRLSDHIELFEMMRREDELYLGGSKEDDSGTSSPVHFESASGMAEALAARLANSTALNHFISLLQHLFMVPCDEKHVPLWRLFDLVLQHICLQSTLTGLSDVQCGMPSMDMADVLCRLHTHCEYERMEKELEMTKEQLKEEKRRSAEIEANVIHRLTPVSPPSSPSSLSSSFSSSASSASSSSDCAPLPPICPPSLAPPPPPPPPGAFPTVPKTPKKNVPKPRIPLKTLNWRKIAPDRVKGSNWEKMDDEKLYKQLDLVSLESQFAAPSGQKDEDTETIAGTISRRSREKVCVVDGRKAQNCTIMLSKLRMPNREIRRSLMAMDERIPKDMIEQMLKFLPCDREIRQLRDAVTRFGSPSALSTADAFLYEMAEIPLFEERLKCLHIIRSFKERLDLLGPSIDVVSRSSSSVQSSRRLRQLLALVLAVGNYLNHGKRSGDAHGFELSSLLCLSELKSSLRADRSLLHFLCQVLDESFPDVGKLRMDLGPLAEAARFSKTEVLAEMRALEHAIGTVRHNVAKMQKEKGDETKGKEDDRFITVASDFVHSAQEDFTALERRFYEMQSKFSECARSFCNESCESPDVFFSTLHRFVLQMQECQQQVWVENEHAAQVKRQTIARSFFARKNRKRERDRDFEQLISALQNGELFSDELSRLRSSFRVPSSRKATVEPSR